MEKDLDRFRNNNADNQNDPFGDDLGLGADFFNDQDVLPNNFDLPQAPSRLEPDESRSPRRSDGLQGTVAADIERLARENPDDTINMREQSVQQLLPGEESGAKRRIPAQDYSNTVDNPQLYGLSPAARSNQKLNHSPTARSASSFKQRKDRKKDVPARQHSVISGPTLLNPEATTADVEKMLMATSQKTKDKEELEDYLKQNMKRLVGTQTVIDRAVQLLDTDPWDDLGNWPADATAYKGMRLSESKMKNEIDHREPRTSTYDGRLSEYALLGTVMGSHSDDRRSRKSDIEELGEGTNLYFKFLKYFMLLFFICTLLSGPALAVYLYGMEYDAVREPFVKWLSVASLGNLGSYQASTCSSAGLPPTKNRASYIGFRCDHGKKLRSLQHFGLAYKNNTCVGLGFQKSVKTVDRCTMGSMTDLQVDYNLQQLFETSCVGKTVCSMFLDYSMVFTPECRYEIDRRLADRSDYGPAKVYAIAQCESTTIRLGQINYDFPWDLVSIVIVVMDCLTMFVLSIGIIKLRWFEYASVEDLKQGKTRIDDFSVVLPHIPISSEDYHNNPDLLTAMIAVHLEEIVGHELQCIPELEEIQMHQSHILDINYGLSSQTTMGHLVKIWEECEKIADLKKKIQVDPAGTRDYEATIWRHYAQITYQNDLYYEEKQNLNPVVMNAYITFRSMEGKRRAINAYNIGIFSRVVISYCCCLDSFFKKKKLIRKGYLTVNETVDPQIITWENLGHTFGRKCIFRMISSALILMALAVGFGGQVYFANLEKDYDSIIRSDCSGETTYDLDQAWLDIKETNPKKRLGIMNCYCTQMYDIYQEAALKTIFPDGEQHCKTWYYTWVQARFTAPALGGWIAIMNVVLTGISSWLGRFKKGKDVAEGYKSVIFNIFLSQYINTALIVLLAQNSFLWPEEQRSSLDKSLIIVGVFDEFNSAWYLRIGTAIIFAQGAMIVFPHVFTILQSMGLCCLRLLDRRCTCNTKNTSKIIQSEYENLYTGPDFILEVRYGQVLSTIFVTVTFSSGMPGLYAVNFFVLFVQYWVDKWLLFNFYRRSPQFTKHVSNMVVDMLPFAIIIHLLFGFMTFSYPYVLRSQVLQGYFGNNTQYFSPERIGQTHMVIFFIYACLNIILFLFEDTCTSQWSNCSNVCSVKCAMCCAKCQGKEYNDVDLDSAGFVYSDDLLYEINFGELYRLYRQAQKDKQKFKKQKEKGIYDNLEIKLYIDPYLGILERNYKDLRGKILELVDLHEDALPIGDLDVELMSEEQKIEALYDLYDRGTNKDNAEKAKYEKMLDSQMRGRIMNEIQSYHFLENAKYRRIQRLLQIMNETFGFEDDGQKAPTKKVGVETPDNSENTADQQRNASRETGRGELELPERTGDAAGTRDSARKPPTRSDFGFSRGGNTAQRDPQKIGLGMKMNYQ